MTCFRFFTSFSLLIGKSPIASTTCVAEAA
jgi:hypothetical protein